MVRSIGSLVFCALYALLSVQPASAQVAQAQLSGEVNDSSGKRVSGASLKLIDMGTNAQMNVKSDAEGIYVFFPVRPGSYRITVEFQGFKRIVQEGVMVLTGERIHLDFELKPGAVNESITVTADAPLLRSDSANLGQVVDNRKVVELPLNGRSFITLAQLAPGVALTPGSPTLPRINGGRPRTNEYLYDGISVLQPEPGTVAFSPMIDSIQEFKIETNSPSAEFGRFNGGVVNLTMKSGTNDLHGSLFEFFRNEKLSARNLFSPATAASPGKPLFRRNQYGFTLGGPIEEDHTFFFIDYQGSRQKIARVRTSTAPTLAQRQGIFSGATIYQPDTTRTDSSGAIIRDPWPGNTIPMDRWDPVAKALLDLYPLPTVSGSTNNYTRTGLEAERQDQGDVRLDHRFGPRDQMFGRFSRAVIIQDPATPFPDGSGNLTSGALGHTRAAGTSFASNYVHTFSSAMTNEVRVGYTRRSTSLAARQLDSPPLSSLSIPGIPANGAFGNAMPQFIMSGFQQLGPPTTAYSDTVTAVTEIADTLSFQRGAHFLKIGADLRWEQMDVVQPPSPTGTFTFSAVETGLPGVSSSGSTFASFLLGKVDKFSVDLQPTQLRPRAMIQEYFIQDDWKATRRLTVTAGVRYTLNFPSTEVDDQGAVFNLATQKLDYLGENGFPRSARKLHKLDFGPRIGLAFRADDRTVIRSGYAVVWIEMSGITTPFTNPYFPFLQSVGQRSLDGVNQAFNLKDGPSVQALPLTTDAALGQGALAVSRDLGSGYVQQWNLSIQREIMRDTVVEIAYTGSKITHVGIPDSNINQLTVQQLSQGSSLQSQVPNPYYGVLPATTQLGGTVTIAQAQLLKPYPRFTNISLFRNNVGNTNYNAFQIKVERRLSQSISALVSYTRSKLIDEASSVFDASVITGPTANYPVADSFNRKLERDVSTGDVPNNFVASATWNLPGRGRLFGGWLLSTIVFVQSGLPLAISQTTNFNDFAGFGVQRPNLVGDPTLPADQRTTAKYFDTAAFSIAPVFTIGSSSRNPVRGPGYREADLALIKRTPVGERVTSEFRAELFNLTNTPPLGAPGVVAGISTFGVISSAGDPRVLQVALKLGF